MIFNRFAREARGCVEAALEEARMLGHDSVGDEDLLLGILRAGEGIGAEALTSLGVTLDGARRESEEMFSNALASIGISLGEIHREAAFDMRISEDRRIPFSPRAKDVLQRALRESERLRDNRIGTEARPARNIARRRGDGGQDAGRDGSLARDGGGQALRVAWSGGGLGVGSYDPQPSPGASLARRFPYPDRR